MEAGDRRSAGALALVAFVVAGVNLRPGIVAVSPLLELIRADLSLSYGAVSFLTVVPTLCFGLFAFAAPAVARRVGRVRGMVGALVLVGAANALRLFGGDPLVLFGTTVLLGVGIAIGQAFLPALVNQYFRERAALVTGLYSTTLVVGAVSAASGTVPIRAWAGSWEAALAAWAIPVVPAVVVWAALLGSDPGVEPAGEPGGIPYRDRMALLAAAFFVGLVALFYSTVTWLAPRFVAVGLDARTAGNLLALFFVGMAVGTPVISKLADRRADRRPWFGVSLSAITVGLAAITVVPLTAPSAWVLLVGIGNGGLFSLALTLPVDYAGGTDAVGEFTAFMMGTGYLAGAAAPYVVGTVRDATGSYVPSFGGLLVVSLLMAAIALFFRPRASGASGN